MTLRVTVGSSSVGALAGLQSASQRLAGLQKQLATGQQIDRPSDDPAATVRALELRSDLKRNTQYARNMSDATAWLMAADTAYGQITDLVQKARTLTNQASNLGASTGASATAIAEELESIRQAILNLANTSYNGRPIFGGTTTNEAAFVDDGTGAIVYQGDDGVVTRAIGTKNSVQISQTGIEAFGADGDNIFDLIDEITANLRATGDPASASLPDPLGKLFDGLSDLTSARAASGAALARIEAAEKTQASDRITIATNLSEIQDIDFAEVAIAMSTAQVVYQASLQTTASIRQMSLMDFLR